MPVDKMNHKTEVIGKRFYVETADPYYSFWITGFPEEAKIIEVEQDRKAIQIGDLILRFEYVDDIQEM